jgi:hypothetical protein
MVTMSYTFTFQVDKWTFDGCLRLDSPVADSEITIYVKVIYERRASKGSQKEKW